MVVNVFLLRDHIKRFDAAIDPNAEVREFAGAAELDFHCRFFLGAQHQHRPAWFDFVNSGLVRNLPDLLEAGVSGVLVVKAASHFFAITFGRGRHLLASGCFVEDFGLKVALNRIDENDLKSIDKKVYDEIVTTSRVQVSRDAGIENFGVDVARDILRAVQGKPKDEHFASRLAGADAVSMARPGLEFRHLGALCAELLGAYGETGYQTKFKWVDNVKQVRDERTLRMLEAALVTAMQTRNLGNMHLTLTDGDDGMDIIAYQFTGAGAGEFRNLELAAYLQHVIAPRRAPLDVATLRQHRLKVRYSGAADFERHASIYDSLVWETTISGETYALFGGRWFRVEHGYAHEVQRYWRGLLRIAYPLPDAALDEKEQPYNRRVAAATPGLALFDSERLTVAGGLSPIEFCDLMSDQGQFIHVKLRYTSATFSHLFAQGSVAAESFLSDPGYRRQAMAKLTAWGKTSHLPWVPAGSPIAARYEVVYAVIAPANAAAQLLPFFSAVNLRQHGQRLGMMGMRVTLQHVLAR